MSGTSDDPLADTTPLDPDKPRFNWIRCALALIIIIPLMISVMLPSLCKSRETANRVKCANNLRQIGLALSEYASAHGGQYPDSFQTLFLSGADITAAVFNCPSTTAQPALGNAPKEIAAHFGDVQYESYVYAGNGLSSDHVNADTVIAYDMLQNHGLAANVLFGDGHVEFMNDDAAKQMIDATKAGKNPVQTPQ